MTQGKKPEEHKERQGVTEYALILSLVALGVWFVSYIANPGKHLLTLLTEVEATIVRVGLGNSSESKP